MIDYIIIKQAENTKLNSDLIDLNPILKNGVSDKIKNLLSPLESRIIIEGGKIEITISGEQLAVKTTGFSQSLDDEIQKLIQK